MERIPWGQPETSFLSWTKKSLRFPLTHPFLWTFRSRFRSIASYRVLCRTLRTTDILNMYTSTTDTVHVYRLVKSSNRWMVILCNFWFPTLRHPFFRMIQRSWKRSPSLLSFISAFTRSWTWIRWWKTFYLSIILNYRVSVNPQRMTLRYPLVVLLQLVK